MAIIWISCVNHLKLLVWLDMHPSFLCALPSVQRVCLPVSCLLQQNCEMPPLKEEDNILEGFDLSALCRHLFPLHSDLFYSSKTQSLRFLSQATLLHVSSPPMYVRKAFLMPGYSLLSFKLLSLNMGIEKPPKDKAYLHSLTWAECGQSWLFFGRVFTHCCSIMADSASSRCPDGKCKLQGWRSGELFRIKKTPPLNGNCQTILIIGVVSSCNDQHNNFCCLSCCNLMLLHSVGYFRANAH